MKKKMSKFEQAVARARTPKGKKAIEKRLNALRDESSALYTIQEHARTEEQLQKAPKYMESIK